jgi:hypothetical protein
MGNDIFPVTLAYLLTSRHWSIFHGNNFVYLFFPQSNGAEGFTEYPVFCGVGCLMHVNRSMLVSGSMSDLDWAGDTPY